MKIRFIILFIISLSFYMTGCSQSNSQASDKSADKSQKYNKLTPEEENVIVNKGTEAPFTGKYEDFWQKGVYVCKRCGATLYLSDNKFDAHCGWPSFDDAIPGAVKRHPDPDGQRTEIECTNCGAHLGHVFLGEGLTAKNTRYCVNSISMNFISAAEWAKSHPKTDTAIFAGGCFWGVQYYLEKTKGVISTETGYINSKTPHPTYEQVCTGKTGAAEAVRVVFNPALVSYEDVAKMFFDIHDPTELNRQGPDVGLQYRSAVFYKNDAQKATAEKLIGILKIKGLDVQTKVVKADNFWLAEDHHQHYYDRNGEEPYCHKFVQRF
jgi:peptide methionine sulfoxide reductase msrA/msrB